MKLFLKTRHLEIPKSLTKDIERRLRVVLSRFGGKISHVTVRFSDVNGTRGGVDKLCRVEARVWGRLALARRFATPRAFPFRTLA